MQTYSEARRRLCLYVESQGSERSPTERNRGDFYGKYPGLLIWDKKGRPDGGNQRIGVV